MNYGEVFTKGLWKDNPVLRMMLGMCPVLGVSTSAINGFGMGTATLFVLLGSNIAVALLKSYIPAQVRIPAYIIIIATFVTVVDMSMAAWFFDLYLTLGLFIPLIVVNCIILGRAEGFASKNTLSASTIDALGMGIGFTLAITTLGACRELLGNGSFFDVPVLGAWYPPALVMVLPPGAFIMLGFLAAGMRRIDFVLADRVRAQAAARRVQALKLATGGAPEPAAPGMK
ncbi:MAG TPA: electron transport complex subunit E [bacterium]|jgi:electron transport complex protein RnfE